MDWIVLVISSDVILDFWLAWWIAFVLLFLIVACVYAPKVAIPFVILLSIAFAVIRL